jgi:SAM-dependent methyltransferase
MTTQAKILAAFRDFRMPSLTETIKFILPTPARRWLSERRRQIQHLLLPAKRVRHFDRLRRITPISRRFGWDRGLPIDRYYIERFLAQRAHAIRGHVLEIQDNTYTLKFGGDRVTRSDVLDIAEDNPHATIKADLTRADQLPGETFDCIICTQTLLLIYDLRAALRTLHRLLKPGGVLLVTVPGIAHPICRDEVERDGGDYWRFTNFSARRLFAEFFPADNVEVEAYGNVLTAIAFLHGLAVEELLPSELEYCDPDYEVSIAIKATKPAEK